jgi:hypothetical protein
MLAFALSGALTLSACGADQTRSQRLASYARSVNRVEARLAKPYEAVSQVGSAFVTDEARLTRYGTGNAAIERPLERRLTVALREMLRLRGEVASIRPPRPAARLQPMLLKLVDDESVLTRQLRKMIRFLPGFAQALRSLPPATRKLQSSLAASASGNVSAALDRKAAALREYRRALAIVLARLRRLRPPAVSLPEYLAQVRSLEALRRTAAGLAFALTRNQSEIAVELQRFDQAAVAANSKSTQRAEIAAIRAYDARVRELSSLQGQIQAGQERIDAGLPLRPTKQTATTRTG